MKKLLVIFLFFLISLTGFSQGTDCASADPFCTGTTYDFPLSTSTTAQTGPDYDCLLTQPNPVWYYLQIDQPGDITITMNAGSDIDFVAWGPFASQAVMCSNLTSANVVDCSFSIASSEDCDITGALPGEFYMMMITNYAGITQNVTFSQTSGLGSTDCSIICEVNAGTDQSICIGDQATLGGSPVYNGGLQPVTYLWDNAATITTLATDSTPTVEPLITTTYTVTMTTDDGCTSTDDVLITVIDPTASFISSVDQCLTGNLFTFTNTGDTGPGITWDWTLPNSNTLTSTNENVVNVSWANPGTYIITQTVTIGTCTDDNTDIIEVFEMPTVTMSTVDEICAGACDGSATANPLNGTPGYTYQWLGIADITQTVNALCANNYFVTVTDLNGCTATNAGTVSSAQPIDIDNVTVTDVLCNGDNTGGFLIQASGGCTPITYNNGISNTTGIFTNLLAGSYDVTITDCNSCSVIETVIVDEPEFPLSAIMTHTDLLCFDDNLGTATANVSGGTIGYTYQWLPSVGIAGTIINVPAGNYQVTITDANNCQIFDNVEVNTPSEVFLAVSQSGEIVCFNQDVEINASTTGGVAPYIYYINGVYTAMPFVTNPTGFETYIIYAEDINGCTSNIEVVDLDVFDNLNFSIVSTPADVCLGDPVTISCITSGGTGGPYQISFNGNIVNVPFTYWPNLNESVTLTATDYCSTASSTVDIDVHILPTPQFSTDIIHGCEPLTVHFDAYSAFPNETYRWVFGDESQGYGMTATHEFDNYGMYDITLMVTDEYGCSNNINYTNYITVYENPDARFYVTPSNASIIDPVIQFDNNSQNNYWNYWTFGDGDTSMTLNPVHTYNEVGDYMVELKVVSIHNCRDSAMSQIIITDITTVYFASAFSPDGDGINDFFGAVGENITPTGFGLCIYDRWGEVIFESSDIDNKWDGKAKNGMKTVQIGVYTYTCNFIDVYGVAREYAGTVTVIR